MDPVKLLRYKAQYKDVYYVESNGEYAVCRQPTLNEIIQMSEYFASKNVPESEQFVIVQKLTLLEGNASDRLLRQIGEQIMLDIPMDQDDYVQNQYQALNKASVHKEVLAYVATNIGLNMNEVGQLPLRDVYLLFGIAKKIEEYMEQMQQPEPVQQRIQVNPKIRNA